MKRNITFIARNVFENTRKSLASKETSHKCIQTRCLSYQERIDRQNNLFNMEKKRQQDVGRLEKIEVRYLGVPNDTTLIMNKDLSTPYDCSRHLSETHMERSALAIVDGNTPWDMHKPLTQSCTLELQHFMGPDTFNVNRAFWRTCSFVLGAVACRSFKDKYEVKLHSFPTPDVRSGSFVYDAELVGLGEWIPKEWECRALSAEFIKFTRTAALLERLMVNEDLALDIFQDNPHKTQQIPNIARKNDGKVTLYRTNEHIDISKGPMINKLSQIGRATVMAVHRLAADGDSLVLHRFQGVALPTTIIINHMAYSILEERAARLNPARSPLGVYVDSEDVRAPAIA